MSSLTANIAFKEALLLKHVSGKRVFALLNNHCDCKDHKSVLFVFFLLFFTCKDIGKSEYNISIGDWLMDNFIIILVLIIFEYFWNGTNQILKFLAHLHF